MNKKTLLIGAVLVVAIFCFSLVGCAKKTTTTTTSTLDQLQAAVTQLQTDVNAIELELDDIDNTALSNLVTTLQTTVNTLTTKINGIQIALDALSDNGGVSSTIEAEVTSLRVDLTSLSNTYNTIATTVSGLVTTVGTLVNYDDTAVRGLIGDLADRVTDLEEAIEDFITDDVLDDFVTEDDLEDILNDIEVLNANDIYLQNLIGNTLLGDVNITGFSKLTATTYQASFKVNKAGTFAVILTLYGTGLDTVIVSAGTYAYVAIAECTYGEANTMKTILLSPDSIKPTTATTTIINWTAGQTFTVYFTIGAGSISCLDIDTAVR